VKHVKICKKVFVQKRKEFDVKEMRKPEGIEEIQSQKMNEFSKPFGLKKQ
jgi:hypothetical protein